MASTKATRLDMISLPSVLILMPTVSFGTMPRERQAAAAVALPVY